MGDATGTAKLALLGAGFGRLSSYEELASLSPEEWRAGVDAALDVLTAPRRDRVQSDFGESVATGSGGFLLSGEGGEAHEAKWSQPGLPHLREELYRLREPMLALLSEEARNPGEKSFQDIVAGVQVSGALLNFSDAAGAVAEAYSSNHDESVAEMASDLIKGAMAVAPGALSAETEGQWKAAIPVLRAEGSDRTIASVLSRAVASFQELSPGEANAGAAKALMLELLGSQQNSKEILPAQSPQMLAVLTELSRTLVREDASRQEVLSALSDAAAQAALAHGVTRQDAVARLEAVVPVTQAELGAASAAYQGDIAKLTQVLDKAGISEAVRPAAVLLLANEGMYREVRQAESAAPNSAGIDVTRSVPVPGGPALDGGEGARGAKLEQLRSYMMHCDPNTVMDPKSGTTALMVASRLGMQDAADSLLARGADPSARNADGATAADLAHRGALFAAAPTPAHAQVPDRGLER